MIKSFFPRASRYMLYTALAASALIPTACTLWDTEYREVTAERIARPAFMVERRLSAGGMDFQLWERMHENGAPANVYIEGDGYTQFPFNTTSWDPTPGNPLALHLASRDEARNLAYISRPCQFRESQDEKQCAEKYWSTRRFAPEVIAAYNDALDEIKNRYHITQFNLIGYDGGANIAAIIAGQRKDVASLRTVAGNLNPAMVYEKKKEKLDPDNIKIYDIAASIANVPQHHFIGAADDIASAEVYHSFRQQMGDSACVHYSFVQDADHQRGWVEKWPELLKATVACEQPYVPAPLPPLPVDKDHGMK